MKRIAGLIGVIVISLMLTPEKAVAEQKEVSGGIFDVLSIAQGRWAGYNQFKTADVRRTGL